MSEVKKEKYQNKRVIFYFALFFLFLFNLSPFRLINIFDAAARTDTAVNPCQLSAAVMEKPRIIHKIKTLYFDILYSKESTYVTKLVADNADNLFEKALAQFPQVQPFRIPIIISPDSTKLSVTYTSNPYNRIVIYEGVPDIDSYLSEDTILQLLYHEIVKAVSWNVKSKANKVITKFIGDFYQPVSLINLPFSMVEGPAYIAENEYGNGRLSDGYFLQILSQAKLEGKFPQLFQIWAKRETYPYDDLAIAAGTAFTAYLQQSYGIEKFAEFWNECGKLYLNKLTMGIFRKVYGIKIDVAWQEFFNSVPLPENLLESDKIYGVKYDNLITLFDRVVESDDGLIVFDSVLKEVFKLTERKDGSLKKHHLFYASDIQEMTIDGEYRYLFISFLESRTRTGFIDNKVRVYDLKKRKFKRASYKLASGCFVDFENGEKGIAAVKIKDNVSHLVVYKNEKNNLFNKKKINPVYEKIFDYGTCIYDTVYAGENKVAFLVYEKDKTYLTEVNFISGEENKYLLSDFENDKSYLRIKDLRYSRNNAENRNAYFFQYTLPDEHSFTRSGCIYLDENFEPEELLLSSIDISGGQNNLFFHNERLYFVSRQLEQDRLCYINFNDFKFENGKIQKVQKNFPEFDIDEIPTLKELKENYDHGYYFAGKYLVRGQWIPFFPVSSMNFDNELQLSPGLGFTYTTKADIFENNTVALSGGWGFLKSDYSDISKTISGEIKRLVNNMANNESDVSFAAFYKNTSTAFDLKCGSLLLFNQPTGQYTFYNLAGMSWSHPLFLNVNTISFNFQTLYTVSTDYYDSNKRDTHPTTSNWPSFNDAYNTLEISIATEFTNIHQQGMSAFTRNGILLGAKMTMLWDLYEIKRKKELEAAGQKNAYYDSKELSQANIGYKIEWDVPALLPIPVRNSFVFSMPFSLSTQVFYTLGEAHSVTGEVLLFGSEVKSGIKSLYLYLQRIGIYFGYKYSLNYDTKTVILPDVRDLKNYYDVFNSSTHVDDFYLKLVFNFTPALGGLSNNVFDGEFKFSYLPRTNAFSFSTLFKLNF